MEHIIETPLHCLIVLGGGGGNYYRGYNTICLADFHETPMYAQLTSKLVGWTNLHLPLGLCIHVHILRVLSPSSLGKIRGTTMPRPSEEASWAAAQEWPTVPQQPGNTTCLYLDRIPLRQLMHSLILCLCGSVMRL